MDINNINPEEISKKINSLNTEDITNMLNSINTEDLKKQVNSTNINDILSKFSISQNSKSSQNSDSNNSIDMETIMKVKNVIEKLNSQNDPNANLLYSLKPYLRESKQEKIDQYANLMKISQIANLFNEKGK